MVDLGFKAYIAQRRVTDTPTGDFVADAKRDRSLPDAKTWEELENHLGWRATGVVRACGRQVWRQYLAWRAKQLAEKKERPV